jgi:hypothetical protein
MLIGKPALHFELLGKGHALDTSFAQWIIEVVFIWIVTLPSRLRGIGFDPSIHIAKLETSARRQGDDVLPELAVRRRFMALA